jgi:hypothetical protein
MLQLQPSKCFEHDSINHDRQKLAKTSTSATGWFRLNPCFEQFFEGFTTLVTEILGLFVVLGDITRKNPGAVWKSATGHTVEQSEYRQKLFEKT